mmetsp:Transcript_3597/g.5316  ORF Transcript_3597/g.5316 Transcript_3597/m.5316 type:complete len:103 (-) Transcript_3597:130-438(-)
MSKSQILPLRVRTESEDTLLSSCSNNTGTFDSIASIDSTTTTTTNPTLMKNHDTAEIPSAFLPMLINNSNNGSITTSDKAGHNNNKPKRKKTHRRSEFSFIG